MENETLTQQDVEILVRLIGDVRVSPLDQHAVSTVALLNALAQKLLLLVKPKGVDETTGTEVDSVNVMQP
ncbi:MAG: hypothetical protein ACK5HO_00285 [Pseudomonadota bacterium]|jgi:hypothetical protein